MIAITPVEGANRKSRDSKRADRRNGKVVHLRYRRRLGDFSRSIPANLSDTLVAMWVSVGPKSEKHSRTINVECIGQWAFLAVVAVPRIHNLRAVNTLIGSTPATSPSS